MIYEIRNEKETSRKERVVPRGAQRETIRIVIRVRVIHGPPIDRFFIVADNTSLRLHEQVGREMK